MWKPLFGMLPKEKSEYYNFFGERIACFFKFQKRQESKYGLLPYSGDSAIVAWSVEFVHQLNFLIDYLFRFQDWHQMSLSPWHGELLLIATRSCLSWKRFPRTSSQLNKLVHTEESISALMFSFTSQKTIPYFIAGHFLKVKKNFQSNRSSITHAFCTFFVFLSSPYLCYMWFVSRHFLQNVSNCPIQSWADSIYLSLLISTGERQLSLVSHNLAWVQ